VDKRALVRGHQARTIADYPQTCLHELFAEQATLHPEAEALVFGAERLTYGDLERRSNQVAQFLRSQGIGLEDRIGIFMDRSANMVVSALGTLKAGGAYVAIDPDYPLERQKFIAQDACVRLILTEPTVTANFAGTAPLVYVDGPDSPVSACGDKPVTNLSTPESIAMLVYTSGSTGQPKAACIPHRAVVRTVRNTNYLEITPCDRIAQIASPSWDAAIMELWLALANGAALVGIRREILLGYTELAEMLQRERLSILILNTAHVHQIGYHAPEALKSVRKVIFGGEAAEPAPIRKLLPHVAPGALVNGYGPAEGCVITTYHEIRSIPKGAVTVPIGRPVTNARVYLLDDRLQPVSAGLPGEIFIGGDGVATGYWNRPELTRERFISDPFSSKPGALLYRTGDLARMNANGTFEFIGRLDEQVKVRGYRIELMEVRQAIATHPDVKQVFLMLREDQPGDKRLVAYVTLERQSASAVESIRQHVKDRLPAEMLPASYVVLDSIPLNINGKVDRGALPPPRDRRELESGYSAPETDIERKLTEIWQQLLQVDRVGVTDNFFELGGHSLLAARLIARIEKETGHNIPVASLFEAPTIAQLAQKLKQRTYTTAWSPLVELHASKDKAVAEPFFCVHSLGANLVSFHRIATLLRRERPIYGLQPHGLDGQQKPLDNLTAIASAYVEEVRRTQPHGPYYLGGVCLGGVLAYEMAQQLRAAGEEVAAVILIDSYLPGKLNYLHTRPRFVEYLDSHIGKLSVLSGAARLKYLATGIASWGASVARAFGWQQQDSLARAMRLVREANMRALLEYEPKPYAGKVIQIMCSDAPHRSYEDRRLAWSTVVETGLEIYMVPGNHLTMLEQPHMLATAKQLQFCLDRVTGTAGSSAGNRKGRRRSANSRLNSKGQLAGEFRT
jgi:amino acid adenylation domain-containing protein